MDKNAIITKIALAFFLIGLPFGSFLYLRSGLDFFKTNMAQLELNVPMPDFSAISSKGETVGRDSMLGKLYVVNFMNTACDETCQKTTAQLLRINSQFKNRGEVVISSFTTDPVADDVAALNAFAKQHNIYQKQWQFLSSNKAKAHSLSEAGGDKFSTIPLGQRLFLVDPKGTIRNVYDAHNEKDFNDMVTHITLIMPPTPKKDYKIRKTKEL